VDYPLCGRRPIKSLDGRTNAQFLMQARVWLRGRVAGREEVFESELKQCTPVSCVLSFDFTEMCAHVIPPSARLMRISSVRETRDGEHSSAGERGGRRGSQAGLSSLSYSTGAIVAAAAALAAGAASFFVGYYVRGKRDKPRAPRAGIEGTGAELL
jgi:hypothetical protein